MVSVALGFGGTSVETAVVVGRAVVVVVVVGEVDVALAVLVGSSLSASSASLSGCSIAAHAPTMSALVASGANKNTRERLSCMTEDLGRQVWRSQSTQVRYIEKA
jgi:predicted solute-binding protein